MLTTPEVSSQEYRDTTSFAWPLRAGAWFFSVVLHPLFIPVMVMAYLAFVQHGYFIGITTQNKIMMVVRVGFNTIFFPAVTVLLLKGLGFIKSIQLKTRRERIIPYVATNIFYFWVFLVFKNDPVAPDIATSFLLGIFVASSLALVLNSFFKISMHALGMGAFCGILLVTIFNQAPYGAFLPLMIVILLTGVVATSRLIVGSHKPVDIVSGIIIAIVSQVAAYPIIA